MLNEFIEFKDYTLNLNIKTKYTTNDCFNGGIYGRLLKETIVFRRGLERVFTIIVRRYLFHSLDDIYVVSPLTKENRSEQIELAYKAVTTWSSCTAITKPQFPELVDDTGYGKYYRYIRSIHEVFSEIVRRYKNNSLTISERNFDDSVKIVHSLDSAMYTWCNDYVPNILSKRFYSTDSNLKNKFANKIITFDTIIADAIHEGPLRNTTVLVPYTTIQLLATTLKVKYHAWILYFLYVLSFYVAISQTNSSQYQVVNMNDLANWLRKKNIDRSFREFTKLLSTEKWYGEEILSGVLKKIYISNELTDGTEVVSTTASKPGYIAISDDIKPTVISTLVKSLYKSYQK